MMYKGMHTSATVTNCKTLFFTPDKAASTLHDVQAILFFLIIVIIPLSLLFHPTLDPSKLRN